jgi:hypothetical protein
LQRLPSISIKRAHINDKIIGQKYPAFAHFGGGHQPRFGTAAQFFGV